MNVRSLEVNLHNPRVRARIQKITDLEDLDDGTKLTAKNIPGGLHINSAKLSGYDLHIFEQDVKKITYVVFSFDTPIAWVIDIDGKEPHRQYRFITSVEITPTTERHRDVVRVAWMQA